MYIAKARGWTPHLLDLRNSGDTSGDKSRVVGYSAIVWTSASPTKGSPAAQTQISSAGRDTLLKMAHEAVDQTAHERALTAPPESSLPAELREPRACFVTLQEHGKLRGCIGTLVAEKPLYQAVAVAACEAASQDPRFPPVSASDVSRLHVEISVLTPTEPLAFSSPNDLLRKLHPRVDGVVLHVGELQATFLPQVWDELPDKTIFLNELAQKTGAPADAWRDKNVRVEIYHVESFEDR